MHHTSPGASAWLVPVGLSVALHVGFLVTLAAWTRSLQPPAPTPRQTPSGRRLIRVEVLRSPGRAGTLTPLAPAVPTSSQTSGASRAPPVAEPPALSPPVASSSGSAAQDPRASLPAAPDAPGPTTANVEEPGRRAGGTGAETSATTLAEGAPGALDGRGPSGERSAGGGGPALEGLIHQRLASAAERCYPSAARRFRQKGVVSVGFCVTESGGVGQVELKGSSGVPILDAAATTCVIPHSVPLPREAATRCFEVPVRFGK